MTGIVLDSFALLAFLRGEDTGVRVRDCLLVAQRGKKNLFLSYINLAEVYYKTVREQGRDKGQEVLAAVKRYPLELVSATDERVLQAAEIKSEYRIALADCFAVALAREKGGAILTGDPEFKKVERLVEIEWLTK